MEDLRILLRKGVAHSLFPGSLSLKFVTGFGIVIWKPQKEKKTWFHWWVSELLLANVIPLFAALDMNTVNE